MLIACCFLYPILEPLAPKHLQLKEVVNGARLSRVESPKFPRRLMAGMTRITLVLARVIRAADHDTLAKEIQEKMAAGEIKNYYKKEWKTLAGKPSLLFFGILYLCFPQKHHRLKCVSQKAKPSSTSGMTLNICSICSRRFPPMQEVCKN
jgi:hypothetical protein